MSSLRRESDKIYFNTSELSQKQVQEIKHLLGVLADLVTSEEESEFFENSAGLIQCCIGLIEKSNFIKEGQRINSIPYSRQAIEYALDSLKEYLIDAHSDYDN